MVLYPQVQAKAQEELDRVVGSVRLPTFEGRSNLPYVNALVLEVMRWHTVAPTGFPHVSTANDIFEGWLIPKGTLVIPILWYGICLPSSLECVLRIALYRNMLHDPDTYPEPFKFKPERFLGDSHEPDPHVFFGFGRR
jgi:cytochrome P450